MVDGTCTRALPAGAESILAASFMFSTGGARADAGESAQSGKFHHADHGSLSRIGAKLADPTSNVWALSLSISGPQFFDGDRHAVGEMGPIESLLRRTRID